MRVLFLLLCFLGFLTGLRSINISPGNWYRSNDFAHYYITSKIIGEGGNPYSQSLDDSYKKFQLVNTPHISQATNPPSLALFLAPFALFSPFVGWILWTLFSLSALLASVLYFSSFDTVPVVGRKTVVLMATLCFTPTIAHISYGQAQFLMMGIIALGLSVRETNPKITDLLYGFASGLKLFSAPLVVVSITQRKFSGLGYFCLGFAGAVAMGGTLWRDFFLYSVPFIERSALLFNANVSLSGAIGYLSDELSGNRYSQLPLLFSLLSGMFFTALGFWRFRSRTDEVGFVVYMLLTILLVSPVTWNHYLVLALPALILLYTRTGENELKSQVPLLVSYFLLCVGQGRLTSLGLAWQLSSPFVAPMGVLLLLHLLFWNKSASSDLPTV